MEKIKIPCFYKTRFYVYMYAAIVAICLIFQAGLDIIQTLVELETFEGLVNVSSFINFSLTLPIDTIAKTWVAICSVYVGCDRVDHIIQTKNSIKGEKKVGTASKVRKLITINILLLVLSMVLSFFSEADLALESLAAAFGSSALIYIGGQKGIAIASQFGLDGLSIDEDQDIDKDLKEKVEVTENDKKEKKKKVEVSVEI